MTTKKTRRTTEWYRADELYVDPNVQRRLMPSKIAKMTNTLDLDGIGVLTVNLRKDGTKSTVDGQHRREVLIVLGMGEWKVKCDTYHGLSLEDEHRLWRRLNDSAKAGPWDDFRSGLAHEDVECVDIARICESHGFQVAGQKRDGTCAAIRSLQRVYRQGVLDDTFAMISAAWGRESAAADGKIIDGLGLVLETYDGALDRSALTNKLGKINPSKLIGDGRLHKEYNGGSIPHAIAERVVDLYNRGRRAGVLPPL